MDECSSGLQRSHVQLAQDGEHYTSPLSTDRQLICFAPIVQVDLLLREGPTGLHLADLQNVQLAYKCPGAADETDQNASLPAKDLAATEEKTATSSRSGLLMTNDMDADNTTANASMSESSCRTAAAAAAAAAAAPTIGLPRSTRLGSRTPFESQETTMLRRNA